MLSQADSLTRKVKRSISLGVISGIIYRGYQNSSASVNLFLDLNTYLPYFTRHNILTFLRDTNNLSSQSMRARREVTKFEIHGCQPRAQTASPPM